MNILKNYFKVAFRNLLRQRTHSIINILGLSTGLCFSLLICLYVLFEISFDNFHEKGSRIYLLPMTWHFNGTDLPTGANCSVGGPFMKQEFPEVEETVRIRNSSLSLKKGDETINEASVYFADSAFFKVFTFPFLQGDPNRSLVEPNSIVLTERMAIKYFGEDWSAANLQDHAMVASDKKLYKIQGVIKDVPLNSHLQFDFVVSFTSLPIAHQQPNWDNSEFYTYVLLNPNASASAVRSEIPTRMVSVFGDWIKEGVELDLVPLKSIYLDNIKYKVPNTSNILYVNIFISIAILILVVATFNYINLSTARSMERAMEVGVRKVMGAYRRQLFYQFMSESIVVTSISLMIALSLTILALPVFNFIIGKSLDLSILATVNNFMLVAGGCLLISLMAGIYPSLVLSNYQPAKVLKGKLKDSVAGINLRRRLVIIQFSISIALIISALTISSQLNFMRLKNSGYDRDQIVSLSLDSLSRTHIDALKAKASSQPWILSMSATQQLPVNITFETAINTVGSDERKLILVAPVDADFLTTMGIEPIAGTNFSKEASTKKEREIILNESALDFYGWTSEEALGKEFDVWQAKGVVRGVVKDFHFASLHKSIAPLLIFTGSGLRTSNLLVKVDAGFKGNLNEELKTLWNQVNPDSPFLLTYLNERYELLYKSESTMSSIVNLFALLAAFISGLGLFGLASYSILQRTKELGIRKVLGASVNQIVMMVSVSFVKQVVIAFMLAAPVSYYLMSEWLTNFNYRIDFNWLIVALSGLIAIAIALLTVSYHSIQVARNNPVDSLRTE
jgi:putative ABC transport system permease protein